MLANPPRYLILELDKNGLIGGKMAGISARAGLMASGQMRDSVNRMGRPLSMWTAAIQSWVLG